jgi:hypothetical protein
MIEPPAFRSIIPGAVARMVLQTALQVGVDDYVVGRSGNLERTGVHR